MAKSPAIYEKGAIRPIRDIGLKEHQWVRIKIRAVLPRIAQIQEAVAAYLDSKDVPALIARLERLGATDLVTRNPQVLRGLPVMAGTRVPVYVILRHFSDGDSVHDVAQEYPTVSAQFLERLFQILTQDEAGGRP